MKHQGRTWWLFGLASALLLAAVGWVSVMVLRLESAQWAGAFLADREEKARLSLWRMESQLAALVLEESTRPPLQYAPFQDTTGGHSQASAAPAPGDVWMPSPLLGHASSHILLHFQIAAGNTLTSPQVPEGRARDLAETGYATREKIQSAATRLDRLRALLEAGPATGTGTHTAAGTGTVGPGESNRDLLRREARVEDIAPGSDPPRIGLPQRFSNRLDPANNALSQSLLNSGELLARQNVARQSQGGPALPTTLSLAPPSSPASTTPIRPPRAGQMRSLWLGDTLFLVRGAELSGERVVQGCWLDWPTLRRALLGVIRDLLPDADLEPSRQPAGTGSDPDLRALASLPLRLALPPAAPPAIPWSTPVRVSLGIAWACVVLATLAAALLLHGAVRLGERRGAFVSAVTHELRSPLTTFRMYSEMLAEGMVTDPATRQAYLETLCAESNRLGHLVENVLAFAGLERGSARRRCEDLPLGELIARVWPRLEQRARQVGTVLERARDASGFAPSASVRMDVSTVEQILFNLVDNACKYATAAGSGHLELAVEATPSVGLVRVRDHGPGIAPDRVRRLFQPFNKSANEAAVSAPGIGLGLALSRRLARSLGGDLLHETPPDGGACFVLRLPRPPPEPRS
jgi:signal transduction histidine kinase